MNAQTVVSILLEMDDSYNPYDIDDPLEKQSPAEIAHAEYEQDVEDFNSLTDDDVARSALEDRMREVVRVYISLKNRKTNPDGSFDRKGVWWPSATERQPCCSKIRSPTRSYPYSLVKHCRTLEHVANTFGVDFDTVSKFMRSKG